MHTCDPQYTILTGNEGWVKLLHWTNKITFYNDIKILMGVNFWTPYLTYFAEIFDFGA